MSGPNELCQVSQRHSGTTSDCRMLSVMHGQNAELIMGADTSQFLYVFRGVVYDVVSRAIFNIVNCRFDSVTPDERCFSHDSLGKEFG